ncbi:MAG: SurA N-terminal domain-containing protein [Desulfurivibrio sp.]|nr:SurA N-terminal domain-containing protein [Desulfurivibrio sp.]
MLALLRRKARSPIVLAAIAIIVLVFIFWLPQMGGDGGPNTVAVVNEEPVSLRDFQRRYDNLLSQYREQFDGAIPPDLLEALGVREQVLNELINQRLLLQSARQAGLLVTGNEIQREIQNMEEFSDEAERFSLERYRQTLAAARVSVKEFEQGIRTDLLRRKIIEHLAGFVRVRDDEVRQRFHYDHDQVRLAYLRFDGAAFRSGLAPTEEELTAYFEENSQDYRTEPGIRLDYLLFTAESGEDAGDDAFSRAGEAYEAILSEGSLERGAEVVDATVRSTDLFSRSQPPAALAPYAKLLAAAFELREGELSSIINAGDDGYAIFHVRQRQAPAVPPLEDVRGRVRDDLIARQARQKARQAAAEALAALREGHQLAAVAADYELEVNKTPWFARATIETVDLPGELLATGLRLSREQPLPEEVVAAEAFYVPRLLERRPGKQELFERRAEPLRQELRQAKQQALLTSWLNRQRQQAKIRRTPGALERF